MNEPRISLIVCTRNRASGLPRFFASLASLSAPVGGWELVIVDNGSTDDTKAIIDEFGRTVAMPVLYVHESSPGLARARNAGLAAARGAILAFTDDDCYPRPDFLIAMAGVFDTHQPGFVGGRVLLHDPADARIAIKDLEESVVIRPRSYIRPGLIHGANMAISREVVRRIGGFDPHLGAGTACFAGEDTEYLARASWDGSPGRYDAGPVVSHHHGRKPGPDAQRHVSGYDYGRGAYFAASLLHPAARRTYFGYWWRHVAKSVRKGRLSKLWREAVGASRYYRARLLQPAERRNAHRTTTATTRIDQEQHASRISNT